MTPAPAPDRPAAVVASTPYPWPFHGHLDPARTALVCCLDETWRPRSVRQEAADARLGELARVASGLGVLVVAVTATPAGRGRARPAPHPSPPLSADVVVEAGGTSGFYASPLDDLLRRAGRHDLLLAGWGLEGPVHSTLRSANDRGYECCLVADACGPTDATLAAAACSSICLSGGIFGAVASTSEVLAGLAGLAGAAASPPAPSRPQPAPSLQ